MESSNIFHNLILKSLALDNDFFYWGIPIELLNWHADELIMRVILECIDENELIELDYTDLVLLDLKQMNDIKYTELTGRNLSKTLIFAERLESRKIPVWIRHVLIPGKTDDEADLMKLSNFVNSLTNVEDFELLKYHTMGVFKWEKLGYAYPLEGIREANDEDIMRALGILNINL